MRVRGIERLDVADIFALIQAKAMFDGCQESLLLNEDDIESIFFDYRPRAKAIVAIIDDDVVGIATYYDIFSTFIAKPGLWLDDLYVYDSFRDHGVGKALISRLCSVAKATGCARIDWIVADDNKNGKGFYHALGATISQHVRHSRLDENAMHQLAQST